MPIPDSARRELFTLQDLCQTHGLDYTKLVWRMRAATQPKPRARWKWPTGCSRKNGAFVLPVRKPSNVHTLRPAKDK